MMTETEINTGKSCPLYKECKKCGKSKHGSKFKSDRATVCKTCKNKKTNNPEKLLVKMEKFKSVNLDISELKPKDNGLINRIAYDFSWSDEIGIEKARELVEEGKAQVYSSDTIYYANPNKRDDNKPLRLMALERDNYTCHYCGRYGDTIDHVIPVVKGGKTTLDNIVCCCKECNNKKADKEKLQFLMDRAFKKKKWE